jgi:tetratricopeptide (TPR) repeat protein
VKKILLLTFFFAHHLVAKTVCLNMIVKNESPVIARCLESIKPLIDTWVIVDTGSEDGTQEIVRETLKDKPGQLYERPWVNFAQNRNEALALAQGQGDYFLVIDADEEIQFSPHFTLPPLDKDCYFITVHEEGADHQRIFLFDGKLPWRWEGVLHETLVCEKACTFDLLEGIVNESKSVEGNRSRHPQKYLKDALILETALEADPTNARYVFYLAQSYHNAKEYALSLHAYQKRASMGGWDEEVFWSLYQIGVLQEILQEDFQTVVNSYSAAYQYRPSRLEPLYRLANYYCDRGENLLAYFVAKSALSIPLPADHIFVERWMYSYGIWTTFANCAYELKKYDEAADACIQILSQKDLPDLLRERVKNNLKILTR